MPQLTEDEVKWHTLANAIKKNYKALRQRMADANDPFEQRAKRLANAVELPKTAAEDSRVDKTRAEVIHEEWSAETKKEIQRYNSNESMLMDAAHTIASKYIQLQDNVDFYYSHEDSPSFATSELNTLLKQQPDLQSAVKQSYDTLIEQKKMLLNTLDEMIRSYESSPLKPTQAELKELRELHDRIALISAGGEGNLTFQMAAFNELKKTLNAYNNHWKTDANGFVDRLNNDTSKNHTPRLVGLAIQAFLVLPNLPITAKEREELQKLKEIEIPATKGTQKELFSAEEKWHGKKTISFSALKFDRNSSEQENLQRSQAYNQQSSTYVEFRAGLETVLDTVHTYQKRLSTNKNDKPSMNTTANDTHIEAHGGSQEKQKSPSSRPVIGNGRATTSAQPYPNETKKTADNIEQQNRAKLKASYGKLSSHKWPQTRNRPQLTRQQNFSKSTQETSDEKNENTTSLRLK